LEEKRFSLRIPEDLYQQVNDHEYKVKKSGKTFSRNEFYLEAIREKLSGEEGSEIQITEEMVDAALAELDPSEITIHYESFNLRRNVIYGIIQAALRRPQNENN
jgi:metal-responsive CopG/Arc/MetJ family transcriptional regulator